MSISKIKTLLLFARYTGWKTCSYYDDWQEAFVNAPELEKTAINICDKSNICKVDKIVKDYDIVVLLHSTNADTLDFINPYRNALNKRKGKLVSFVGNELNFPPPSVGMRDKLALFQEIKPDFIATQIPQEPAQKLYEDLAGTKVIEVPHALNPQRFCPAISQSQRKIDIGVRSVCYYPFLGDNDRSIIINYFNANRFTPPLVLDISTEYAKRLTPTKWAEFLNQCKGTVATEAGSYYLEKDDATVIKIMEYIKSRCGPIKRYFIGTVTTKHQQLIPEIIAGRLRRLLKALGVGKFYARNVYFSIPFEEMWKIFFKDYSNPLNGKCISSRHFDAIGAKTCQIMFPGNFNGILEADKHYISLNSDFSNIDEVMKKFRDYDYRSRMVNETHDYIMSSHTYRDRIKQVVTLLN